MKTFGKIAALAISLIFIIGIMVLSVNAAGNPEITVSDASGNIGDEVTVIISLTSNPGIAGFNADITYDKNNLELTDMSGNSGFGGSFMGNVSKSKFVWYNASNITSTGTFTTLKFKIKDTAKPNTYEIGLSYSQGDMSNADGDDVTATIHAGKITVTCNHTYGSWEKNTAENHKHTCKVCGNVETAAHTWDSGKVTEAPTHTKEGTKTYTCTVCGETKTEKVEKLKEHSYGEWTKHDDKQHKHSCVCGDTQYAAHTWDSGKVTEVPTHTKEGTKTYTCTVCGETKTEKVEKLKDHSYGEWTKHDDKQHIIITFVLCYELITMITEKNNLHDMDTWMFFKWFFKAAVAIYLVTNTFDIVLAVFDIGQNVVAGAAGFIHGTTNIDIQATLDAMRTGMEAMSIGELLGLSIETLVISLCLKIMSILITVILYGRMIEIYCTVSVAPIPIATMSNREWGSIGTNYLKSLFALAFQGFLIMICVGIYAVLINNMIIAANIHSALFSVAAYTVILCFSLFKTGSLAKSIFHAH